MWRKPPSSSKMLFEARYYYLYILCTLRFYYQMRDMPYAKYHQHVIHYELNKECEEIMKKNKINIIMRYREGFGCQCWWDILLMLRFLLLLLFMNVMRFGRLSLFVGGRSSAKGSMASDKYNEIRNRYWTAAHVRPLQSSVSFPVIFLDALK